MKKIARKGNKTKKVVKKKYKTNPYLTTGSRTLDKLLGKGILKGTSVLLLGSPHSGKKPIIMRLIAENCCKHNVVPIVVLTEMGVNNWIAMAEQNKWICKNNECEVIYIDGYSQQFNFCPKAKNVKCLEVPYTLSTLSISISESIEEVKKKEKEPLVIMHTLSPLIETFGKEEVLSFIQFLFGKLRIEGITIVVAMQLGVHGENFEKAISSMSECIITLKDNKISATGYVSIKDNKWHDYKFIKNELFVKL
ncbi:MAG: hypothetical protein NZ903_01395 [Candidatus Micrarchaeota archaeon]|nr:hypothetical protein [Candidatus Micrarchaeota archaeon]